MPYVAAVLLAPLYDGAPFCRLHTDHLPGRWSGKGGKTTRTTTTATTTSVAIAAQIDMAAPRGRGKGQDHFGVHGEVRATKAHGDNDSSNYNNNNTIGDRADHGGATREPQRRVSDP